ncbi:MAG: 30S ribosomal protein S4, partial [Candidatus Omnitrophica bacterium]|nr:30S ribosomal protein S4 [Candidatus Omnitrophota bacterium]
KHRLVLVNSRPVDIPSFLVKTKDVISIKSDEKKRKHFREIIKLTKERAVPQWLSVEGENLRGAVTKLPERTDVQFPIREQLIVELYSK